MLIGSINLLQRSQEYTMAQRQPLQDWCWENCTTVCKRIKLSCLFTPHTNINSKSIKYLNERPEMIELLEET